MFWVLPAFWRDEIFNLITIAISLFWKYLLLYFEFSMISLTIHCVKVSKYGVFSGPYFPVFSPNTGKCGPEKYPYLDAFHAMRASLLRSSFYRNSIWSIKLLINALFSLFDEMCFSSDFFLSIYIWSTSKIFSANISGNHRYWHVLSYWSFVKLFDYQVTNFWFCRNRSFIGINSRVFSAWN